MRSRPCRSWCEEEAHHLLRAVHHRLEHQRASAVDHGNRVLASIVCGGIEDTAVSEGSMHPRLRAPEAGALTHCLVILPRSFLLRALPGGRLGAFQRCLDRGDVALKLPLHPPPHEGQRQPQWPAELDFHPKRQVHTVAGGYLTAGSPSECLRLVLTRSPRAALGAPGAVFTANLPVKITSDRVLRLPSTACS
jgi:hypothetical protein